MKTYEIADIIGVTYQTVQSYRDKGIYPTVKNLMILAEHFNISVDSILNYPKKGKKLSDEDIELIENFNQLSEREKGEIEYHVKQLMEQHSVESEVG